MGHSASSALFEESSANKMNISTTASLPNEFGQRAERLQQLSPEQASLAEDFEQSKPDSLTEPSKIPMKTRIVESLHTGGEALLEPPLEPPLEQPSVVKGCETPDDFGRRRFEQMGLIPLHQLDWIKYKLVEDTSENIPPDLVVEDNRSSEIKTPILHDTVVKSVIEKFSERSNLGMQKYGTTLDRTDLTRYEWANHMQEELMDAILYLERLKREFHNK